MEARNGFFQQGGVVADEKGTQGSGKQFRAKGHGQAGPEEQEEAFTQDAAKFPVIFGAVLETDDRGGADGIAREDRSENHADVHHYPIGGDSFGPGVAQELKVVEQADEAHGDTAHEFRRSIGHGLDDGPAGPGGAGEPEQAVVAAKKIIQGVETAD